MHSFNFFNYFSKKVREEISELYASTVIANLALSIVLIFEPIFLYSALKFTIPQIFLFMAVVYAVYIVLIPWGGKIASIYGYKHAIAMSVPFQILFWMILLISRQNPGLAFVAAICFGLQKSLYWPGFHSLMARYADQGQVGREFGVIYSLIGVTQIIGPFIGGWMSQYFSLPATFVFAAIIYCFSIWPLFKAEEIFVPKVYNFSDTWKLYKLFPKKFLGYLGFGEELLFMTIWPVFIFIVVKNYAGTGLIATVAGFFAAALALIIGRITDQYTKRVLIKLGAFFSSLIWLARTIIPATVWTVSTVDTLARTAKEMDFIPISTVTYLRAEETHVVPYIVFFEQSLSIGKLLACLIGMAVFALTGSFMALFILGALFSLLYMYI